MRIDCCNQSMRKLFNAKIVKAKTCSLIEDGRECREHVTHDPCLKSSVRFTVQKPNTQMLLGDAKAMCSTLKNGAAAAA